MKKNKPDMSPEWWEGGGWLVLHVYEVADVSGAARSARERCGGPGGGDGEEDRAGVQAGHHHATKICMWKEFIDDGI